jgi:hypothetical protein
VEVLLLPQEGWDLLNLLMHQSPVMMKVFSIRHASTIPSSTILKCKRSALDEGASTTSFGSKCTCNSTSSGASALVGIKDMVMGLGMSMLEGPMLQPRHHRKNSTECRIEATTLLQQRETLTTDQVIAFADLVEQNMLKADTYMALVYDDVWKLWVQRELTDLGFPAGAHDTEV